MASRGRSFSWRTFGIGVAIVAAVLLVDSFRHRAVEYAELKALDLRLYSTPPTKPTDMVAIAAVDDPSVDALGHFPWPRSVEARLERALIDYKVAIVGYDMLLSEADEEDTHRAEIAAKLKGAGINDSTIAATLGSGNDDALGAAIKAQGATFVGYTMAHLMGGADANAGILPGYVTTIRPPPPMTYNIVRAEPGPAPSLYEANAYRPPIPQVNSNAAGTAFVNIDSDDDGTMRSILSVIKFRDRYCIPLSLAILRAASGANLSLKLANSEVAGVLLGDVNIPVNEIGQMLIRFRGKEGTFPTYSISEIIAHKIPAEKLAGKIVLVGVTGRGLGDRFVTPMGADFPGVEIHANAIDNVIRGDIVRRDVSLLPARLEAIVLGVLISIAVAYLSPQWAGVFAAILAVAFLGFAEFTLRHNGVAIAIVLPLFTMLATYVALATERYATEGMEKRYLRHAFEHFLHPDVIASLVDNRDRLKLGGERRHVAVLFADIIGYTARAERTSPEALVALLSTYMTMTTDLILESGGVVDKIRGDGIMAFWGAPNALENPSGAAIDCAILMLSGLSDLRARDERFADVDIGIGIATGDVVAGNFGGERRFDYSVIGDTVNFASRLEGLTRQFKTHLLVSRQTFIEANRDYIVREIGLVKVKGKEQLVPIVEVVAHASDGIDPAFYNAFARVTELLRRGDGARALSELEKLKAERPTDGVVALYMEKLSRSDAVPSEMVFEFESK